MTTNNTLAHICQADSEQNLTQWYQQNLADIEQKLLEHGAVLFRGFGVDSVEGFDQFINTSIKTVTQYVGGATPRKKLNDAIATSTEFPHDQEIKLHNELSYETTLPTKLAFCCLDAPDTGGQTQLADMNKVYQLIDPEIIEAFEQKNGWKLIRNFGRGFGPDIQNGFGTTDQTAIEQDCQQRQIDIEFLDGGVVRTKQTRAAIYNHPQSDLPLWINHVAFWHGSSLDEEQRSILSMLFKADEFPYATFFGDGSEIPDQYVDNIRAAYQQAETTFDWQVGDVLLVDNYRVAHGRKPFTGTRKVIVSMGD